MARTLDLDLEQHNFRFQRQWFRRRNLGTYREKILPFAEGRDIKVLQTGVFEAMDVVWMFQRMLGDRAKFIGIDPWMETRKLNSAFMEQVYENAQHNLSPWADRVTLIRGDSKAVLPSLRMEAAGELEIEPQSVDLCIIDGDHEAAGCYADAMLMLPYLRPNGMMVFDDYEQSKPKRNHVKEAFAAFRKDVGNAVVSDWKRGYMIAVRKAK